MFLAVDTDIIVRASAAAVWDYASKPQNWTASNPTEHFGLRFGNPENLPAEGVEFDQEESVAGIHARLHGRFHYMDRPRLAFWSGTATYRILGGWLKIRLPEGGVLRVEEREGAVRLSHNVYIDFPDSIWGQLARWWFTTRLNGRQAVYDHTFRELAYFKEKLESGAGHTG
jgi:hypothetical protein